MWRGFPITFGADSETQTRDSSCWKGASLNTLKHYSSGLEKHFRSTVYPVLSEARYKIIKNFSSVNCNIIWIHGRAKFSANSHLKKGLGERMCNDRGALSVQHSLKNLSSQKYRSWRISNDESALPTRFKEVNGNFLQSHNGEDVLFESNTIPTQLWRARIFLQNPSWGKRAWLGRVNVQ